MRKDCEGVVIGQLSSWELPLWVVNSIVASILTNYCALKETILPAAAARELLDRNVGVTVNELTKRKEKR